MSKEKKPERETWLVTPQGEKWQVIKEQAKRASSIHETKGEAVEAGIKLARGAELGQIKIFKQNGKIQEERTYGKDPRKYKD